MIVIEPLGKKRRQDANRVTEIRHENASATILSEIDYTWTIDNLATRRSECDCTRNSSA